MRIIEEIATEHELRARFLRYLLASLFHRKMRYSDREEGWRKAQESGKEIANSYFISDLPNRSLWETILTQIEDEDLSTAILNLKPRERYVLLEHVIKERSYNELAVELNVGYKGVTAIYYRARSKVRKQLEEKK